MLKRLSATEKGTLQIKPNGLILPQSPTENQVSAKNECQIYELIAEHRLTDLLECLESYGHTQESALDVIRCYLQWEAPC